ncbi:cytochrome o ubiquinol oxidase subunit 1 [Tistlia consotensis]|uniref:Cytochrome o ubiquinol oxidase subunit 1 n=1 Tax=Tistlia consotensis USBA 355 TaxID=560819 RepID=A0A1Y6CSG0_9PROT|nr:cbb3-type cytochrome c oxidase subunit I [Tistlia consotensis]SMF84605.1 cytochrome o ubiquinol oxidase subunit 1 [Tistlia consotensis USBA 355]SNS37288.1 cytochrome o ubiquinol oxidase subunit 1 [Tistlia consotensis]
MSGGATWDPLLGRLGLDALPFWSMIEHPTRPEIVNGSIATAAASVVVLGALAVVVLVTRKGWWRALWSDWLTSVDHKKIGIMYVVLAFVMLARGVVEAVLMRAQQAFGLGGGFLSPEHFGQLFSTHGTIMIFFVAMPFLSGLINFVMPLQIGARDVSFPVLNSISLGLTAAGAGLVMVSLVVGRFSTGGWSGYPPFTELAYSPGVGPDYWIWSVTLSSLGSTLTGVNFAVTIYKQRAPGMHLFRMPLFCWTALCTSILMIFAMPPLTVATLLLALDRYAGFHFFTTTLGGDMMNYANLFWLFGHPEVYILILPAFGVFSEVFSTFSGKRLYGYSSLVAATMVIAVLSFTVWLHHFFTMGQDADINAAFGIATMTIGIPTGVKVYDWLLTLFRGRVRLTTPMIYALGFTVLFVVGGLSGILLANPTIDFQVHNTLFLVAHFHNMLVPGLLFGMLAGYSFWFPKAFGFRLDERWGRISALAWIVGFMLAFFPLYALGLLGMPRRMVAFFQPAYLPWTIAAGLGGLVILFALFSLVVQLRVSVGAREANRVPVGDPWDGRSLEWATAAPPPEYNFPVLPEVGSRDPFMTAKEAGAAYQEPEAYEDIEMPANSALGALLCLCGGAAGFGLVWYLFWLVVPALAVALGALIARSFLRRTTRTIAAGEVRRTHRHWLAEVSRTAAVTRAGECDVRNRGRAVPAALEAAE